MLDFQWLNLRHKNGCIFVSATVFYSIGKNKWFFGKDILFYTANIYISSTTIEMCATSASGTRLQDVVHYISSTSISRNSDALQFKYILSVVLEI
jgi:hypothetical protein